MTGYRPLDLFMTGFLLLAALLGCARADATPPIDRDKLKISLQRTACFGSCPDYLVTIDGYGNIIFETRPLIEGSEAEIHQMMAPDTGILVPGRHIDRIAEIAVDDLVEQFRAARFFELKDEYRYPVTDNPTYILTIDTGNGAKRVVDYVGRKAGMPASVTALEDAVDGVAGTARWVRGTADLLPWLEKQNFDFTSRDAVALAITGAQREAEDLLIEGLLDRGMPLDGRFRVGARYELVGKELTESAIRSGLPKTLVRLAKAEWLDRFGYGKVARLFADSAGACSPAMVDVAVELAIPIDELGDEQYHAVAADEKEADLTANPKGKTALANLAQSYNCDDEETRRLATARRLLAQGADPNRRDQGGETAVFNVENPDLLRLLYAHGANGSVKDRQGRSPVFSSWTDEIVLLHLQNGASPEGRDERGATLRQLMKKHPMPKASRWLSDHGY